MLSKSLIKVGFVGFGNVFNALLGFAFLAAVARTLDLDSFGKYALLTTLLVSISKLIDFGTNSVFVAKSISNESKSLNNLFISTKVLLTLITFPLFIIALALLHKLEPVIILILFLGSIAYGLNYTLFGFFQKEEKYTPLVMLNLLPALIKGIFALLIFFSVYVPNLTSSIAIFSLSITASSFLIPLAKNNFNFNFNLRGIKDLMKASYPAGVSQLIAESWPTLSNAAAKISGGFSDVGIFSLASKVSRMFALASLSIFTVLLPKNANRKKQNLTYDFTESIIISLIILLISGLAIPITQLLVTKIFGSKFQDSLAILNVLIFSAALTSIHTFIENYFFVEQKTNYIMYINIGKLAVFIIFCTLLIPIYSLAGLAFSDLTASLCAVLLTVVLIKKSQAA